MQVKVSDFASSRFSIDRTFLVDAWNAETFTQLMFARTLHKKRKARRRRRGTQQMIEKGDFKKSIALMRTKCFTNFNFPIRNVELEIYFALEARAVHWNFAAETVITHKLQLLASIIPYQHRYFCSSRALFRLNVFASSWIANVTFYWELNSFVRLQLM